MDSWVGGSKRDPPASGANLFGGDDAMHGPGPQAGRGLLFDYYRLTIGKTQVAVSELHAVAQTRARVPIVPRGRSRT